MTDQPKTRFFDKNRGVMIYMIIMLGLQIIIYGSTMAMSPGYMAPFLADKIGGLILSLLIVWQILGFVALWLIAPINKILTVCFTVFVTLFCVLPVTLVPMFGPAILTITQAIGPVMKTDK